MAAPRRMPHRAWAGLAPGCGGAPAEPPAPAAPAGFPSGPLVDLSHTYDATTIFWPTADTFHLEKVADDVTGVDVDLRVLEGDTSAVLLERAKGADLLVVGSRGLGGFRGLLLGSVSQQCVQHATSPVVVVPSPGDS